LSNAPTRAAIVLPVVGGLSEKFASAFRDALPGLSLSVLPPFPGRPYNGELRDIEVLFTFGQFLTDEALADALSLRLIQCLGTGLDGIVDRSTLGLATWVTNARGIHGAPVSETALMLMLALARHVPTLVRAQAEHRWHFEPARLLSGSTVGILGVGHIAEALARRCKASDMRVEGISRRSQAGGFDQPVRDFRRCCMPGAMGVSGARPSMGSPPRCWFPSKPYLCGCQNRVSAGARGHSGAIRPESHHSIPASDLWTGRGATGPGNVDRHLLTVNDRNVRRDWWQLVRGCRVRPGALRELVPPPDSPEANPC
jgi:hypothetical protein